MPKKYIGTELVDKIEETAGFLSSLPGVRNVLQFTAGAVKFADEAFIDPHRYASEQGEVGLSGALGTVIRGGEYIMSEAARGGGILAERAGIDPRIGEFAGGTAAETLLSAGTAAVGRKAVKAVDMLTPPPGGMPQLATAGVGGPQLTMRGGGVNLQPPTVMKATTSPEWTARGMGQGVAETPKYAPAVKIYTDRKKAYVDKVKELQQSFEGGKINAERLKKTLAKVEKIRKGDASTFEYDPKNPYAYKEGIESAYSPYVSTPEYQGLRSEAPRGIVSKRAKAVQTDDPFELGRKAQQHHILAKAETKPFADTLNKLIDKGIGDPDDLVNFFVWPEQYDLFPGNTLNNLLDMGEITHTVAKKDPMALHKILKEAGLEFGSGTEKQIIKRYGLDQIETVDELMQAYDRYLREIAVPSKDLTYKIQDWWYNKTIKTLKGQELKDFKERFAKLNDPRRQ